MAGKKSKTLGTGAIKKILRLVPDIINLQSQKMWTLYDADADVLYINFKRPSRADDSEMTDDDVIVRYEKGRVIGLTVLNASERK